MESNPQRPIEKLLRDYAEKRRKESGGPLEMRAATRRLLQGEVSRRFRKPAAGRPSVWSLLAQYWPRLAWSAGTVGLVVAGILLWPAHSGRTPEIQLAQNRVSSPGARRELAERPEESAKVAAPAPLQQPSSDRSRLALQIDSVTNATLAQTFDTAAAPALKEAAPPSGAVLAGAQASAMSLDAPSNQRYGLSAGQQEPLQQFVALADNAGTNTALDKKFSTNPVLASFQFERLGRQVRIIDKDGSVYSGSFQTADSKPNSPGFAGPAGAPADRLAARSAVPSPATGKDTGSYFFRVAGTNLTSNEQVIFSGSLLPAMPPRAGQALGAASGLAPAAALSNAVLLSPARITGKAVVGQSEIEINAVRSP